MGERRRPSSAPPVSSRCSDCGLRHHPSSTLIAASTKAASSAVPRGRPLTHCACRRAVAGFHLAVNSVTPSVSRRTTQPTAWRTAEPAAPLSGAACGAADFTHLTQAIQQHSAAATQCEARHCGHTRCKHFEFKPFAAAAVVAVTETLARNMSLHSSVVLHFAVATSRPRGGGKTNVHQSQAIGAAMAWAANGAEMCNAKVCRQVFGRVDTGGAGLARLPHALRMGLSNGTSTRAAVREASRFTVASRSSASKSAVPCDSSQAMDAVK